MRKLLVLLAVLAVGCGLAFGQSLTTGKLEGVVKTKDGDPIEGAVVTAMGPQAVQTATTGSDGRFTFPNLTPGKYTVKAEADGYSTVVQSNVQVYISRRTQLPFALPKGIKEEITVVSEAPIVDMKSTTTGESVKVDDFAPSVPIGRNLEATFSIAPGVVGGGDAATGQSISGASGLENQYYVDGVNVTNSGYGGLGSYSIVFGSLGSGVTYEFLEEVQVKTGGFEAEFGEAGGGIVNTVVKTGTNDFQLNASWYQFFGSLEGGREDRTLTPNVVNRVETVERDIALTIGGPLIKDKLFYFVAYNPITTDEEFKLTSGNADFGYDLDADGTAETFFEPGETVQGGRTPASTERTRTIDNYAGKVSWYLTPNHQFGLTVFGDPSDGDVGPQRPTTFLRNLTKPFIVENPATGATALDYGGDQYSLKYFGVWTPDFFTEFQYSHKENNFAEIGPGTEFRSFFDPFFSDNFGGVGFHEDQTDETDEYSIKFTNVFGPVEIKYGFGVQENEFAQPSLRSGPNYTAYAPVLTAGVPLEAQDGIDNDGDGTIDETGLGIEGNGQASDPDSYQLLESSTGAATDVLRDDLDGDGTAETIVGYQVVRTAFEPLGRPTTADENNAFIQASWDVLPNLNVKAGLRWSEVELTGNGTFTLPISNVGDFFAAGSTTFTPKTYDFDDEIAPRLGFSWDILGNGRHKVYANYGEYVQDVPADLAVRQFSNEVGIEDEQFTDPGLTDPILNNQCNADLDGDGIYSDQVACHTPIGTGLNPGIILDGTDETRSIVEGSGFAFDEVSNGEITKLPYVEEWLIGYAWEINPYTGLEFRYIDRSIGRALEDVQFASNEQTWNLFFGGFLDDGEVFDGHGVAGFGAYVLSNPGSNVNAQMFPTPIRDYDAFEVIFNRRMHDGWMIYANYRFAQLRGNYEGSFRNDNGQADPFITSLYDFPAQSLLGGGEFLRSDTLAGQFTIGPLNTERRHVLNAFVSKQFDFGLNVGGRFTVQSGTPRFPLFAHPAYQNSGEIPGFNASYWWLVQATGMSGSGSPFGIWVGDGDAERSDGTLPDQDVNEDGIEDTGIIALSGPRLWDYTVVERDFFGRQDWTYTFDLKFSYDFDLGQGRLTALVDIFNVFSDTTATEFDNDVENRPGVANPNFLKPVIYQTPRTVRLGAKYTW